MWRKEKGKKHICWLLEGGRYYVSGSGSGSGSGREGLPRNVEGAIQTENRLGRKIQAVFFI
jgi:hypothetical protein